MNGIALGFVAAFLSGGEGPAPLPRPKPKPDPDPDPSALHKAVIGQSENVIGWVDVRSASVSNGIYPALLPGVDVQVAIPAAANPDTDVVIRAVTQARIDARQISPGAVALANLWHLGSGGTPLRLSATVDSGSGMPDMMDDDETVNRLFAWDQAVIDAATAEGWGPVRSVTYNWWASEAAAARTLWQSRAPHFFGINPDGTAYDFVAGDLEHCLIDKTGRGYGLLPDDCVVNVMLPGLTLTDTLATADQTQYPRINYRTNADGSSTGGRIDQNAVPAYAQRDDFMAEVAARFPENAGKVTVSPGLVRFGDYENGVKLDGNGPAQVGTHPALQEEDGQIRFGQDVAGSFLIEEGHAEVTTLKRVEEDPGGAHVDFVFALPPGAILTTQNLQRGTTPVSKRPHEQEVTGFVLRRAGDTVATERPVFRADYADDDPVIGAIPSAYKGTVTIHDSGTDTTDGREGIVRVAPTEPLGFGDRLGLSEDGGYGTMILDSIPDYDARLYRNGLRAYEARLDDGSATGYPGLPVRVQVAHVYSLALGATRVAKADGSDAHVTGPQLGSGVTALTLLVKGKIGVQGGFGTKQIIGLNGNGLTLKSDTRDARRSLVLSMEDGTGTSLVANASALGALPATADETVLMVTARQDDGAGNWTVDVYVNGGAVTGLSRTGPTTASPEFEATQWIEALKGNIAMEIERVAAWAAHSPDGSEPAETPIADLKGDAAFWNGDGLPDGWAKQGTATFTDV